MSKRYFINRTVNLQPKNKLDEALSKAFEQVINHEIREQSIYILERIFNEVVNEYKASGGRCKTWNYTIHKYDENLSKYPNIYITVSETCRLLLEEIRGEVLPF